jgi:hypothetical protein
MIGLLNCWMDSICDAVSARAQTDDEGRGDQERPYRTSGLPAQRAPHPLLP